MSGKVTATTGAWQDVRTVLRVDSRADVAVEGDRPKPWQVDERVAEITVDASTLAKLPPELKEKFKPAGS
jgi:hypothetical protein